MTIKVFKTESNFKLSLSNSFSNTKAPKTNLRVRFLTNIPANDSDADSSIDPAILTIKINPSKGAIALNLDGTVTYTPNPTFVGTDTFTDTDGLTSNTATVNITVNNIAP
ncbi:Ig-like domain-containing protein [Nostoc sp. DSM 114159]